MEAPPGTVLARQEGPSCLRAGCCGEEGSWREPQRERGGRVAAPSFSEACPRLGVLSGLFLNWPLPGRRSWQSVEVL